MSALGQNRPECNQEVGIQNDRNSSATGRVSLLAVGRKLSTRATAIQHFVETHCKRVYNVATLAAQRNLQSSQTLKEEVLTAARALFMKFGYEAVGMRDIARAVGKQPVQIYRLKLSKADILAEIIIELNQDQIDQLPQLCTRVKGATLEERTCAYLRELYTLDIDYLPIRSVGAAFGWMWSAEYEVRVITQVHQLINPLVVWMNEAKLDDIPARCMGIWSLYYVGYRRAVMQRGTAEDCLSDIKPSLRYFLGATDTVPLNRPRNKATP